MISVSKHRVINKLNAVALQDMDLQDEGRALVISGTLARRQRSELDWHGWNDYFVVLLDNYRAQIIDSFTHRNQ